MKIALVTNTFTLGGGLTHIRQITRGMPDVRFGVFADGGDAAGQFSGLANTRVFPGGYRPAQLGAFQPDLIPT